MARPSAPQAFRTFTFICCVEDSAGTPFAGDVLPVKDSGQCRIHHPPPKSGAYSMEILFFFP